MVTNQGSDIGKFKTPSLRNVALTAPYMNDGFLTTLEDVVRHYNSGGKPFINKDTLLKPLNLSVQEQADLVAFLKTLTDEKFLKDPRFKKP
jgi:cytochrome c peroxidase